MPIRAFAFDVMETLFSLAPLQDALPRVGLRHTALETLFAQVLRDGFALAAAGTYQPFPQIVQATVVAALATEQHRPDPAYEAEAVRQFVTGFTTLPAHPDVLPTLQWLQSRNVPAFLAANGAKQGLQKLADHAGLTPYLRGIVSVDDVQAWKPLAVVYQHTAKVAGVAPDELGFIAAHPWDCHGAKKAGLRTGFLRRSHPYYPDLMLAPDASDANLLALVQKLVGA